MKYIAFLPEHLEAASGLLAERHRNDRKAHPALPERFEQPEHAQKALQALLGKGRSSGIVALQDDGQLVGYLIGTLKTDATRERHVWVDYAGVALQAGASAELYRDLYAEAAERWVEEGYFKQYVLFPSGDVSGLNAWFHLGFGHEQTHALLALATVDETPVGTELDIRQATTDDETVVRAFATTIRSHQARSPVFAPAFPEDASELRDGYAELIEDETVQLWLGAHEQDTLGYQAFWPDEASEGNLLTPDSCINLGVGGSTPSSRGTGVGTALVYHGLHAAKTQGYAYCSTDWRTTNLLSSRFWPKQGFEPIAYRLFRQIDERVAWAKGE
ncbi:MAG: GNAT family N-acetyltransferase [Tumebacillaceae bacterium]